MKLELIAITKGRDSDFREVDFDELAIELVTGLLRKYDINSKYEGFNEIIPETANNPEFLVRNSFYFPCANLLIQYNAHRERGLYQIRTFHDKVDSLGDAVIELINGTVVKRLEYVKDKHSKF